MTCWYVLVYEPAGGGSATNLLQEHGEGPMQKFKELFPQLESVRYDGNLELEQALRSRLGDGA
jgi:hypothetical protein